MYYVYILFSKILNKTYTGFSTRKPEIRLLEHLNKDTLTTSKANDWILIWSAEFHSKDLAFNFERYLKSHSGRAFMNKRLIGDVMKTIGQE